jgi:AcrR family transcriptional regulator
MRVLDFQKENKKKIGASMGRKSLASERRAQIIEALADVIREEGFEAATLERVAIKAEVQRTLIRHYFGNRDALLAAALVHITAKYLQDFGAIVESLPNSKSLVGLVDYLFGGAFNQRLEDDAVIDALIAASGQSDAARVAVLQMYQTFHETVARLLSQTLPQARTERVGDVAYALMCLAEQHALMRGLGLGVAHEAGVRRAALAMIESLQTETTPRTRSKT